MIELREAGHWQRAVDVIAGFISEGNFRFSDDGIRFRAVDPGQVVLVDYAIDKKFFDKYSVEPNLVGLDIVELSKILSRAMESDRLLMNLTDHELKIMFEGEMSRSFSLPLLDVSEEEIRVPETEFDAVVEVNARILKEALKDANLFGQSVVFRVKNSELSLEASGTAGSLRSVIKNSKFVSIKSKSEAAAKYSLNFLQGIVKGASPESKIWLGLKTDSALKMSYDIGPSKISFHLAHMIL